MVNDLFADLAVTCYANNLSIEYANHVNSLQILHISSGAKVTMVVDTVYLDFDPESVLNDVLIKVNKYLEGK